MKKYNVYKVIGIVIALSIILSYFIPQTTVNYGTVTKGGLNPVSLIDTLSNSITSFNVFISQFIFILAIGVFYGILNKTGKYESVVNKIANTFNNNKGVYVVINVLVFGIVTAVIGDIIPMLVFVPLAISVAKKLGYDSKAAIASSIGAILIGNAGSLYTNITNQMLSTTIETNLIYKIIIALVGLVSLIAFVLVFNKPSETKENKVEEKTLPIIISLTLILIFIILGMTPWNGYFKFTGFEDLFQTIIDFKVGGKTNGVSLFGAIVGNSVSAWGTWQLFDVLTLVGVFSVVNLIVYKIKINEFLETAANSLKKALPYAFILVLANIVLVNVYSSGWFYTIVNGLAGKKFNLYAGSLTSAIAAIVYPDYSYGLQFTISTIIYTLTKSTNYYEVLALSFQAIYSLILLVSPTSVLLLIGLRYTNTRFIDWIKYIWKYFLILFITTITILFVSKYGFNISSIVVLIALLVVVILLVVKRINNTQNEITKKTTTKKSSKSKK